MNEFLTKFKNWLADRFSLDEDKASEKETIESIKRGVEFKGINVWILIFAIMIASIGLNLNSAAVVIGAMLISPLMGPIMGVGLSLGIYDFELLKKSSMNLLVMVVVSIITSALYFRLSPLTDASNELLARTTPSIWDVFIGLFGGLAGIVAGSSKEKGNTVPGVAIATALMPPLCTAGYGIGQGQWDFFIGGFFLFIINSIFIALATYAMVRFLKFRYKEFVDPVREKRVKYMISVVVLLTVIPSIFLAVRLVGTHLHNLNIKRFVNEKIIDNFPNTSVSEYDVIQDGTDEVLRVSLIGEKLNEQTLDLLTRELSKYEEGVSLRIIQNESNVNFEDFTNNLVKGFYTSSQEEIKAKDKQISKLQFMLQSQQKERLDIKSIAEKAFNATQGKATSIFLSKSAGYSKTKQRMDTIHVALVGGDELWEAENDMYFKSWLKTELNCDSLVVVKR